MKNSDSIEIKELAVALSSLVTKILISCTKIDNNKERMLYAQAMNLDRLNLAISNYALHDDDTELVKCGREVRELLRLLYIDE